MTIPNFQWFMLPLLEIARDGHDHRMSEVIEILAQRSGVTDEERRELLPSGRQARFNNRVAWARSHLKQAGLLENPGRGAFRITERGMKVLRNSPANVDISVLMQFPEYVTFREGSGTKVAKIVSNGVSETGEASDETPEESLDSSYQILRTALAQDLLEQVKESSPRFFENVVVDLLVTMGYGGSRADAGQAVGQSGDGGIDGIIKEDPLGLDIVYVQAKRWESTVGRPVVQAFAGSLEGHRARKGVMITTSRFSPDAMQYVRMIEKKIVLVDGEHLANLMIDHGIGVTVVDTYVVKRIDQDYFETQ